MKLAWRAFTLWVLTAPIVPMCWEIMRTIRGHILNRSGMGGAVSGEASLGGLVDATYGVVAAIVPLVLTLWYVHRKPAFWPFAVWTTFGYSMVLLLTLTIVAGKHPLQTLLITHVGMLTVGIYFLGVIAHDILSGRFLGFVGDFCSVGMLPLVPLLVLLALGYFQIREG